MKQRGSLIVLTGPSGVGKGVLRKWLLRQLPMLKDSISVTSRPIRPGDVPDVDYIFVTPAQFQTWIDEDALLEWAEYAGNFYGTPRHFVEATLEQGHSVILEIEVQGALNIRRLMPEALLIFIAPPSMAVLKERLENRHSDTPASIEKRLETAVWEISQKNNFDVVLVNDQLAVCQQQLLAIIQGKLSLP